MRITITLSDTDGQLFSSVKDAAGMSLVENAVYARHLFLFGLRNVARSADDAERVQKNVGRLDEQKKTKASRKRKVKK